MKRRNYSPHTVKNYLNTLKHFVLWINVPVEDVMNRDILHYIDFLLKKRLKPKTINCHLVSIRGFYEYLHNEEDIHIPNPVKRGYVLKQSKPLPKHLRDEEVEKLFSVIKNRRDRAMFKVMLRCGLRVEEVANLSLGALYLTRKMIFVKDGKGNKDRVVYISDDAYDALVKYVKSRPPSKVKKVFLVEKGSFKGKPISVRGIQKRMEYYARKAKIKSCCHQLRHTMATQLLNADMDLVSIQDLLGHERIGTTEKYIKVSNVKVMRDYFKAINVVTKGSAYDVHPAQSKREWV
ncbi:MAG: tyrosine-type recombinase/integrase [Deltaproteobacteria bacterium]